MNRSTLARRYAPLAAVVAVQLLIIATVPSKAPSGQELVAGGGAEATGSGGFATGPEGATEEIVEGGEGATVDAAGNPVSGGGAAGGATGRAGTAGAAAGGAATGGGGTGATGEGGGPTGDTSHCVDGRQFDPKVYYYAPKCKPKWGGGNNGGPTYQGVTDKEVKVVFYRGKPNEAVDAILDAIGANPPDEWITDFWNRTVDFMNSKLEFYGRKVVGKEVKGQCSTVPPDYVCLRGEMRDIVQKEKPFAVMWPTPLASPAFDELSAQKVINIGGTHFRDSFGQQRRPYHWDINISGTQMARQVAEWYCKRLNNRKAAFAGATGNDPRSQNPPTNDIRNKTRILGVISTDDPENQGTVTGVLKPELAKCGAKVSHEFYYAQDIARAEEQRRLGMAKMRENPESTTIMCFCDAVAPVFLYRTAQEQSYYPEHVIVGSGGMDADVAGQSYDFGSTLCNECHQFENAFGLRALPQLLDVKNNEAVQIYRGQGGKLVTDFTKYVTARSDLDNLMLLGTMIQAAGPQLTPANVERGLFAEGTRGGSAETPDNHFNLRGFKPGTYSWAQDMEEVYYSQTTVSEFNGKKGAYVPTYKNPFRRFNLGEWEALGADAQPPVPPDKPR